ncbi:MAG TPA: efflux RND transporter permease subunit [Clostridia bacterium]|nr:efflux RND transporter permease subunit [Clostridia bacterium]
MNLSEVSIKRPITTLMIILIVVIFGIVSLFKLPIDLLPSFEIPVAIVSTNYQGVGPQEMENLVTRPLEESIATVGNIESISSITSEGQSVVIVQFAFGTDMDFAALEMREKIDLIKGFLPDEASAPMVLKIDLNAQPIVQISLSNSGDLAVSQSIAEDMIKPRLERLEGVASVEITGGYENQIQINVKNEKMHGYGLTTDYIAKIIGGENLNLPGGEVQKGNQELTIRTVGEIQSLDEIENLLIPLPTGGVVHLNDIANVEMKNKELTTIAKTNGQNAINISVQKQSGTNTVQVANVVSQEIEKIQEANKDLDIQILFDQSDYIKMAINSVAKSAVLGAVLAVIVLLVFLKNFRSTFIIATAIPVSVITAFTLLYFSGVTLNLMTLGGLALGVGMLVDNSIVVLENIYRFRQQGYPQMEAAHLGAKEVSMAITASTLTTVAVFLPIVFMEGITSTIFKEMALTFTIALFASLIIALTLVPMLSSKLLKIQSDNQTKHKITYKITKVLDRSYEKVELGYKKLLNVAFNHRAWTVLIAVIIFAGTLASIPLVGTEFLPETDEGQFLINVSVPAGAELEDIEAIMTEIEGRLMNIPEIETVFSTVGSQSTMGIQGNNGNISCVLNRQDQRQRSTQEVADEVRNKIFDIPGAEKTVIVFSSVSLGALGGGAVGINIKGDDIHTLKTIGDDISEIIGSIDGTKEVESSMEEGIPEVQIRVDRTRASQYGLTAAQIASSVRGTVSGITATQFKYEGDEIDVVISGDDTITQSITNLEQMMISTPAGFNVPLSQVAEVVIDRGPFTINREGQVRMVTVSAQTFGRDLGSISSDIEEKLKDYNMPAGYTYEMGGENKEMMKAFQELALVLILAVILVYMVLAAQFESLINPLIIMISVPLGLSGGILALVITGTALSVPAYIGLIMLAGIVVNNAIVLIDYILTLRNDGEKRNDAILKAGPVRLRPVLMTTLTTILGLIPLAFGSGEGSEMEAPLAIAVIGGLTISTVLTLVFIPIVYSLVDDAKNHFRTRALEKAN